MITVTEAQSIINNSIVDFGTERIALMHSIGKVLRENIYDVRDFPPDEETHSNVPSSLNFTNTSFCL